MSITVDRLDADSIKTGSIIVLLGRRGTGKSVCAYNLLYKLRDKHDFALCFTPTQSSADLFAKCMPRRCIYDRLDLTVLQRLLDYQASCLAKGKRCRSTLVILDDTSWEAKAFRTPAPVLGFLARNGRHSLITVLITAQTPLDLGPAIRSQVDYAITLREVVTQQRKKLYETYFGVLPTFESFCHLMDITTENYGALCLLNSVNSNDPAQCLRWWRAKASLPPFRLPNDVFFRLAETMKPLPVDEKDQTAKKGGVAVEMCGASTVVSV